MDQTSLLTKMPLGKWLLEGANTNWKQLPSPDELMPIDYAAVKEAFALFRSHDIFCGDAILQYTPDSMLTPDVVRWVQEISGGDEVGAFLSKCKRMPDITLSTERACSLMRARGKLFFRLPLTVRKQKSVQLSAIAGCQDGASLGQVLSTILSLIDCSVDEEHISVAISTHPANCLKNVVPYLTAENFTRPIQTAMVQKIRDDDKQKPLFLDSPPFLTDKGTQYFDELYRYIRNTGKDSRLVNKMTRLFLDAFPESINVAATVAPVPQHCYADVVRKDVKFLHLIPPFLNDSERILKAAILNERDVFLVQSQLASLRAAGVKEDEISALDICEELGIALKKPEAK